MDIFEQFTGLYPISKTLRFELKPIGKTLENIEKKGLIAQDEQRNREYQKVKDIIDRYHKQFIKMCLHDFKLKLNSDGNRDSLEEYIDLISKTNRDETEERFFEEVKKNLRKQIAGAFKNGTTFGDLFKKELIQKHLVHIAESDEEKAMIENFGKFTTYFTGFHKNRQNMYFEEENSTAIAYRLINENLPTFYDNMRSFEKIAGSDVAAHFGKIEADFQEYLNVEHIHEMFLLDYFSIVLTQEQIEVYNRIIGGRSENNVKIQGINEYVNLYNQQQKDKSKRLPMLKPLYKMILSDRVAISWLPEKFGSDEEMLNAINEVINSLQPVLNDDKAKSLKILLQHIDDYDLSRIYISNDIGLTDISQQMFGQYDIFTNGIKKDIRRQAVPTKKEKADIELYEERINKLFKSEKSFSIAYLNSISGMTANIEDYFAQLGAYDRNDEQRVNLFTHIEMARVAAADILAGKHTDLNQSETDIKRIKDLLDAFKSLQHFIKPLLGNGDEADKDNEFYAKLREAWDTLDIITPLYNKVRTWLTRKPYSTEKIKLNFENPQLLGGWDMNKEPDCTSVILRKEGIYFLAIMDKKANHAFDCDCLPSTGKCFEKIDYKLLPGANKMLPKVFFSKSRINEFAPSDNINNAYKRGTHKKGANFSLSDCHRLIDFFKDSISKHEDWNKFGFNFSETNTYKDISDFYKEVEQQGYMLGFRRVSEEFINRLVSEGKLYLFQIWNKDFSEHSKGTPNLHTIYWKMLFDEKNLSNVIYKLNGQAELFFRRKSLDIEKTTIHKAHQPINNKNTLNDKRESIFDYDIIKNRRYTVDKFQLHVPITINFKATGDGRINNATLEAIHNGHIEHVIGIDRGERHLLYLSLIDLKGNIVKQFTLNEIKNEYHTTNYKDLLVSREGDRNEARRNWQKIENIKEIKEGYLSQVVHVISRMMVEYKAIVVLEDLNKGFMRGRQKIERQVYEKFEKMLIDKLNCYVDKQKDADDTGGALHPLQLTSKFESFRKLGKQSGWLFYIPAWNTSKIDPVTGFVNMLDTRYENADKARLFFSKFDTIRYNKDKDLFEFTFDYNNFTEKAKDTQTKWTLCTYGTRIKTFRNPSKNNQWDSEEVVLTDEFKKVLADAGIDINENLKEAICSLSEKKHLEPLMHLMKLLLQMRNSKTGTEIDYLLSPVADENGIFYDSRKEIETLPKDADANGAYNIARKGLWAIRKIRSTPSGEKLNLAISNKEWLQFAQQRPYLDE